MKVGTVHILCYYSGLDVQVWSQFLIHSCTFTNIYWMTELYQGGPCVLNMDDKDDLKTQTLDLLLAFWFSKPLCRYHLLQCLPLPCGVDVIISL